MVSLPMFTGMRNHLWWYPYTNYIIGSSSIQIGLYYWMCE